MRTGARNLITDIAGIRVGNAQDEPIKTGTTVLLCDEPCTASCMVLGGAPGTRETDLLAPENSVEKIDALVLGGGSAFGLDAASGVQDWLVEQGRGFQIGPHKIPIVPAAILFDLINGGNKDWGPNSPYRELGYAAAQNAAHDFAIGSQGAGTGALAANVKGGLGSASSYLDGPGVHIGALVAANPLGTPLVGDTNRFWASPFEIDDEFGGLGLPFPMLENAKALRIKHRAQKTSAQNTTIGIIATDAKLSKAQCKRMAIAAHDGFARAIWPSHTPFDGDLIFALSTGQVDAPDSMDFAIDLGAIAASTMARAIARGIYHAQPKHGDILPAWCNMI